MGACSGSCWWSPTRTRYIFVPLPGRGSVWRVLVRVLVHMCGTFDTFWVIHAHAQPGQHLLTIPTPTMTPTISVMCCHGWAGVRTSQTCMQNVKSKIQDAECKLLMQKTECEMLNAECVLLNAECSMHNPGCKMQNATCRMQHAKSKMQHTTCNMQKSPSPRTPISK